MEKNNFYSSEENNNQSYNLPDVDTEQMDLEAFLGDLEPDEQEDDHTESKVQNVHNNVQSKIPTLGQPNNSAPFTKHATEESQINETSSENNTTLSEEDESFENMIKELDEDNSANNLNTTQKDESMLTDRLIQMEAKTPPIESDQKQNYPQEDESLLTSDLIKMERKTEDTPVEKEEETYRTHEPSVETVETSDDIQIQTENLATEDVSTQSDSFECINNIDNNSAIPVQTQLQQKINPTLELNEEYLKVTFTTQENIVNGELQIPKSIQTEGLSKEHILYKVLNCGNKFVALKDCYVMDKDNTEFEPNKVDFYLLSLDIVQSCSILPPEKKGKKNTSRKKI